jgi:hypothetical protein
MLVQETLAAFAAALRDGRLTHHCNGLEGSCTSAQPLPAPASSRTAEGSPAMPNRTLRLLASCSALLSLNLCTSAAAQDGVRLEPAVPGAESRRGRALWTRRGATTLTSWRRRRALRPPAPEHRSGRCNPATRPHDPQVPGTTGAAEATVRTAAWNRLHRSKAPQSLRGLAYSARALFFQQVASGSTRLHATQPCWAVGSCSAKMARSQGCGSPERMTTSPSVLDSECPTE